MFYVIGDITSNKKSHTLDDHSFSTVFDTTFGSGLRLRHNEQEVYRLVSYVYAGVHRRANTVANYPVRFKKNGRDLTDSPALSKFKSIYKKVMYRTEMSLCTFGRAYWLEQRNQAMSFPYWASPTTVIPIRDPSTGRIYQYDRMEGGEIVHIPADSGEIVPIFVPSLTEEEWYGVSPVQNALASGNVLLDLDVFSSMFFNRGAIKFTLLRVSGNPDKNKLSKLESWWKSIASGVQRAFETVLLRDNVEPMVIGDGLKDIETDKLVTPRREDICVSLGVPRSLVDPSAANFATAQQDTLNFYEQTITPELEMILSDVNPGFFEPRGFMIEPDHSRIEAYQRKQLETSEAVSRLYEKDMMTLNECRSVLGQDDVENGDLFFSERKRKMSPPPMMIPGQMPPNLSGGDEEQTGSVPKGETPDETLDASSVPDDEAEELSRRLLPANKALLLERVQAGSGRFVGYQNGRNGVKPR